MKNRKVVAIAGAALGIALAATAVSGPAFADPVANSYVLVGSDTLQDSANALINGTKISGSTVRSTTSTGLTLGSFDAFGSATIQTKPGGVYFTRPSGSGDGVTALRASISGSAYKGKTITGAIDIARSSSGPGSNANANGQLAYYPYARDAVAYAYKGNSALGSLTKGQLTALYSCATGATTDTIPGMTIAPRLPQQNSGTRNFFLQAIGLTDATVGTCVADKDLKTAENDASVLADSEIIPFSSASWIAQANAAAPVNTTASAGVALGSPLGSTAPYSVDANGVLSPNSAYYGDTTWGRDTYLVVEYARVTDGDPKYDAALAALVNRSLATSLTNFGSLPSTSGAVKRKFGFLAPNGSAPLRAFATL